MTTTAQCRPGPIMRIAPRAAEMLADRAATEGRLSVELRGVASSHAVARVLRDDRLPARADIVNIGEVAGCSVLAERDEIVFCPHDGLMLVVGSAPDGRLAWLLARPESASERHDRALSPARLQDRLRRTVSPTSSGPRRADGEIESS